MWPLQAPVAFFESKRVFFLYTDKFSELCDKKMFEP